MDAPKFLFSFLLSTLILYSSASASGEKQTLRWSRKHTTQHDSLNFPTSTPAIVTVPSATPVTVTPTPATVPSPTTPPAAPATNNPVNTPTITPPAAPVTNPVTTPVVAPPATTGAPPASAGQSWCVAKSGAPEKSIQAALDYACGIGGADCSTIQQGASCFNPNTLLNHASYAFNSYYQRNPLPTSCDFGGAAAITTSNPSSGSCVFATSATTATPVSTTPTVSPPTMTAPPVSTTPTVSPPTMTATPVSTTPTVSPPTMTAPPVFTSPSVIPPTTASPVTVNPTPTPNTASSTGASPTPTGLGIPPSILNSSNPGLGGAATGFGIGDGSPVANMTSAVSVSSSLEPFVGRIVAVAVIVVLGM